MRDPYRRTSSDSTIHDLIEKVKDDYKKTYEKYFYDEIQRTIERQRNLLYERVVAENPDYAIGMPKRVAKRTGYVEDRNVFFANVIGNRELAEITYDTNGNLIPLSQRFDRNNPDIRYSLQPLRDSVQQKFSSGNTSLPIRPIRPIMPIPQPELEMEVPPFTTQ
ncbi:MAG: hypothetical protein J6A21_00525 [Lentisphaeria bacterium]|nr:hypothetical protein [Lentisphaeria bacterium]